MPMSKTKTKNAAIAARTAALPQIPRELLDQFVAQGSPMTAEQISATTMALKKALIERALGTHGDKGRIRGGSPLHRDGLPEVAPLV